MKKTSFVGKSRFGFLVWFLMNTSQDDNPDKVRDGEKAMVPVSLRDIARRAPFPLAGSNLRFVDTGRTSAIVAATATASSSWSGDAPHGRMSWAGLNA